MREVSWYRAGINTRKGNHLRLPWGYRVHHFQSIRNVNITGILRYVTLVGRALDVLLTPLL